MAQAVLKETDHDALAEQVAARQKFLEGVISFTSSLLHEKGKRLRYEVRSFHTVAEFELKSFGDFSYHSDGPSSEMGAINLKIWYHPSQNFHGGPPVLEVNYGSLTSFEVLVFNPSPSWQEAIQTLVENPQSEVARIARERTEKEEQEKAERERETKLRKAREKTLEEAKRLKIIA